MSVLWQLPATELPPDLELHFAEVAYDYLARVLLEVRRKDGETGSDLAALTQKFPLQSETRMVVTKIDSNKIPKFSQLPIKPRAPADSNCGVFRR